MNKKSKTTILFSSLVLSAAVAGSLFLNQSESVQAKSNKTSTQVEAISYSPDNEYIGNLSDKVTRQHVTYKNRYGITLAADLYYPKDIDKNSKHPALVIGPPYSGVKEQGPSVYANQMAERGYVVVAFDPSFNGYSEGEPRHTSSPEIFTEDFSASVDYLGSLDYVDREQIAAIGICGSGGFALSAAQVDPRIKTVVTTSMVDISANYDNLSEEERSQQLQAVADQRWADVDAGQSQVINPYPAEPATEVPSDLDPAVAEFYSFYSLERGHHKNARGGFTTTSQAAFMNFHLLEHLESLRTPVMMVVGSDAMSKGISEAAYTRLDGQDDRFLEIPNANHVDLYDRTDLIPFDQINDFIQSSFAANK